MALETERTPQVSNLVEAVRGSVKRLCVQAGAIRIWWYRLGAWFKRQPLVRFISASLLRRILVSNLVGLAILLGTIFYLSNHHAWLIDAKRDSLQAQGRIIAAAIASNAALDAGRILIDPTKLTSENEAYRSPLPDDGFAALELSIKPERVTPVLRRLLKPADDIRARIYAQDGTLIVDTAMLLTRGQIIAPESRLSGRAKLPKTKNFWTRLRQWLIDKQLPVYKEIGTANGTAYSEVRKALAGTPTAMLLLDSDGRQIVSTAEPIQRFNTVQGVLLLSTRPGEIDKILWEERAVIITFAVLTIFASVVTSLLLARTVADPMRRLSAAAERVSHNIAAGQNLPAFADRPDEVGQMTRAFGAMTAALCRRIEASEKFAADVAHELKNPLTAARSTAESLRLAKTEEHREQLVQQLQFELKRLNRLITDVSNASRLDAELARQEMHPVNVTTMLDSVVGIFRDILREDTRCIALEVEPAPFDGAFVVPGNDSRLCQVVTNLVDNAISFSPEAGTITVRARRNGSGIEIAVEDEGPGIPEDRIDMIFDRFYTDRPATEEQRGKNSGLGLSISREIVRSHGGEIRAENRFANGSCGGAKPLGARFVVVLPASPSAGRGGAFSGRHL